MGLALVGPTLVIGLYVVAHGHQTPGGGFQGGVILATALLLVFLADQYVTLRRVGPMALIELAEAAGAAALGLIGIGGMIWAGAYFANFLGVGHAGRLLSGGIVLPGSMAVGLAVTGGFAFMLSEFLEQTLVVRRDRRRR
jgi:multicomponent Na+:H+ antiporter subunit B